MSSHDVIEIFPKNHLSILVFRLEVAAGNGHHPLIDGIIDMASHCHPTVDAFDIIKHEPCIFKLSTWLHLQNQIYSTI